MNEVIIQNGGMVDSFTLDDMANKIAVAYSYVEPGTNNVGVRKTTDYAQNAASVAAYGTKEFISSAGGLDDATAERRRDLLLDWRGIPRGSATQNPGGTGCSVELICHGWYDTLNWRYADVSATAWSMTTATTDTPLSIGNTTATYSVGFYITTGGYSTSLSLSSQPLRLCMRKVGSPTTDAIDVNMTIGSSDPGASSDQVIDFVVDVFAQMSTDYKWIVCDVNVFLPATLPATAFMVLPPNTKYWFEVNTPLTTSSDYYQVKIDPGTAGGSMIQDDAGTWTDPSTDFTVFRMFYPQQRARVGTHISELVTNYGEFITGVDTYSQSSSDMCSILHDGSETVWAVIEQLCKTGSESGLRIFPSITEDRRLVLEVEPAEVATHFLDNAGTLTTPAGLVDIPYLPTIGVWVRRTDMLPGSLDSLLVDPGLQFIEGADWTPDGVSYVFRNSIEALDERISGLTTPERTV